jgi:hypothetical protein
MARLPPALDRRAERRDDELRQNVTPDPEREGDDGGGALAGELLCLQGLLGNAAVSAMTSGGTLSGGKQEGPKEIHATKKGSDGPSALLARLASAGGRIDTVDVVFRYGGKIFRTLRLKGVLVSGFQSSRSGEEIDSFSLTAEKSEDEYHPQSTGSGGGGGH